MSRPPMFDLPAPRARRSTPIRLGRAATRLLLAGLGALGLSSTFAQSTSPASFDVYTSRQNHEVRGHDPVPCPDVGVTLILGQSNAANFVGDRFRSARGVDRLGASCYRSAGPTLGSDGMSGSVWPLVADLMRQPTQFVAMASGGTSSYEWADPARLGGVLKLQLADLQARGLRVDRVLWHQGEADGGTDPAAYAANVGKVIAQVLAAYPKARFYVAQASICDSPSRALTLAGQATLVDGVHVYAGPNTDLFNAFEDRYDGCHFSSVGARKVASAWAERINAEPTK